MNIVTVLMVSYALILIVIAVGLHALGRRGGVRVDPTAEVADSSATAVEKQADWPHSEVPKLHTGVAIVAAFAATILPLVAFFSHPKPVEAVVLGAVSIVALAVFVMLVRAFRATRVAPVPG